MTYTLTKEEKETTVLYNQTQEPVCISTYDPSLRQRLANFAKHYPDLCKGTDKQRYPDYVEYEAIAATHGMVLTYNGKVANCFYCASNKGQTKRSGDVWSTHYPYYMSKPDEWDEAARAEANVTSFGHGVGMSQHGAMWAARHGVSYTDILTFYYKDCSVTDNYGFLNQ